MSNKGYSGLTVQIPTELLLKLKLAAVKNQVSMRDYVTMILNLHANRLGIDLMPDDTTQS